MSDYNWSKFILRVPVNADVQKIYDAWAKPSQIEKWFLRKAEFRKPDNAARGKEEDVKKDDAYTWMWYGYSDDVAEKGKVLEANGIDLFSFSFGTAGDVTVKIKAEEGETIVELLQENIPVDEKSKINYHIGCTKGWTFYLANLKSILEGGMDLRNKNEKLKDVVSS